MAGVDKGKASTADQIFIGCSIEKLQKMADLIHSCFDKLDSDLIWKRASPVENSLANLVLHLCGNARQWIGCFVGGLADVRNRPAEFAARETETTEELLALLDRTIQLCVEVLQRLEPSRLTERIPVQDGKEATVLEAIYQVVGHFQQHTGQIVYATKLWTAQDLGLYQPPSASALRTGH